VHVVGVLVRAEVVHFTHQAVHFTRQVLLPRSVVGGSVGVAASRAGILGPRAQVGVQEARGLVAVEGVLQPFAQLLLEYFARDVFGLGLSGRILVGRGSSSIAALDSAAVEGRLHF